MQKIQTRTIQKIMRAQPTLEGAGVHLNRAFGNIHVPDFDPFLLLDDFRSDIPDHYKKGFPWHPHRGIETITYVLRGEVDHADSMGNEDTIASGDVQWMTAGSGIVHQEMPRGGPDGRMHGFQLWANLPSSHKMMDPRYRGVRRDEIPEVVLSDGARVRVISGKVGATQGPVRDVITDPEYLDVTLPPRTQFNHPTKRGHTVFSYVIEGRGVFTGETDHDPRTVEGADDSELEKHPLLGNRTLVLFNDGDRVVVMAEDDPVRFLLISGRPIGEPVAWYGPIVMNTQAELQVAFDEYANGTFLKKARK